MTKCGFNLTYITSFSPSFPQDLKKKKILITDLFILCWFLQSSFCEKMVITEFDVFGNEIFPNDFKISTRMRVSSIKRSAYTILRAPYRYKLGRLKLLKKFFKIDVQVHFNQIRFINKNVKNVNTDFLLKNLQTPALTLFKQKTFYFITYEKNFILNDFIIIFVYTALR